MGRERTRHSLGTRRALSVLLATLVLLPANWGCALFRDPQPPGFDAVQIRTEIDRDRKDEVEGDFRAYSTLQGVLIGAVTGGPTLAVVTGGTAFGIALAACAPPSAATTFLAPLTYVICVGVVTALATAGGFIVGLGGGIYIGAVGGLPTETAERVTETLARLEENQKFDVDWTTAMQSAIPSEKQVDSAEAVVTASIESVALRQHSKDHLSFRIEATMEQEWEGKDATTKEKTCDYRLDTERKTAKDLLENEGTPFRESIVDAMAVLAAWMNRDLEAFASETEFDETEESPESCYRQPHWYDWLLPI
jgi:hypothetical protein